MTIGFFTFVSYGVAAALTSELVTWPPTVGTIAMVGILLVAAPALVSFAALIHCTFESRGTFYVLTNRRVIVRYRRQELADQHWEYPLGGEMVSKRKLRYWWWPPNTGSIVFERVPTNTSGGTEGVAWITDVGFLGINDVSRVDQLIASACES